MCTGADLCEPFGVYMNEVDEVMVWLELNGTIHQFWQGVKLLSNDK